MQRCGSIFLLGILSSTRNQQFDNLKIVVVRGHIQRSDVALVTQIDIHILVLEYQLDHVNVADGARQHEWLDAILGNAEVDVANFLNLDLHQLVQLLVVDVVDDVELLRSDVRVNFFVVCDHHILTVVDFIRFRLQRHFARHV